VVLPTPHVIESPSGMILMGRAATAANAGVGTNNNTSARTSKRSRITTQY
jgi:hypothetical protein